jgi:hypothetical protein
MDLVRLGRLLRAIRMARGERLVDVSRRSGVSRSLVGRMELGDGLRTAIGDFDKVITSLGATWRVVVDWRGADLDQLVNAAHSAMHERIATLFARLPDWQAIPEVSFSIFGERGVIDWLAWHPATRSLLIVEIKTALVDVQAVLAQVDRYLRLAARIAADQGWRPVTVNVWVVFEDSNPNRRAVANHRLVIRAKLPSDGVAMRRWLRAPNGSIRAVSFLSDSRGKGIRRKRVRVGAPAKRGDRPNSRGAGITGTNP